VGRRIPGLSGCSPPQESVDALKKESDANADAAATLEEAGPEATQALVSASPDKSGPNSKWTTDSPTGKTGKFNTTIKGTIIPSLRPEKIRVTFGLAKALEEEADTVADEMFEREYLRALGGPVSESHFQLQPFSDTDIVGLKRIMKNAFWAVYNPNTCQAGYGSSSVLPPNEIPGMVYTKIRTTIHGGSPDISPRMRGLFSRSFKDFSGAMNVVERRQYQNVYNEVAIMTNDQLSGSPEEGIISDMQLALQKARQAVVVATTAATRSESVAEQLREIEKDLEGEDRER
jgi:hypothetical protein